VVVWTSVRQIKFREFLLPFYSEPLSSHLISKNLKIKIYRTIILPVVFYGCETWSLTLREEHILRAFKNTGLMRIFGSNREEVAGGRSRQHN